MRQQISAAQWQRSITVLSRTLIGAIVVAGLFWAQSVLVPVAMALFLTLILAPVVTALERRGLHRTPAVVVVVLLATLVVGGLGWIVTAQIVQLAADLPAYRNNIKEKVRSIRALGTSSATGRLGELIDEISGELRSNRSKPKVPDADVASATDAPDEPGPQAVVVQSDSPVWVGQLTRALSAFAESLASGALSFILVVFMLLKREELRDRVIRLMGRGRMTATTKALEDAVQRIGRFLLMQFVVNGTYGLALAAGLFAVGVDYALVWGFLAAVLRYIPYIGAWIAAIPPVLLSFVMFEGWVQPALVVGWIVLIELVSNNVVEPMLYGQSMGVSEVALLVAAAFWAFLWGPIGLVLSSPLTVCLVVLGKHVPQLEFFDILLGDEPALEPHVSFYQRLLARDVDEAAEIALSQAKSVPTDLVFDNLILPSLSFAKRDTHHEELSDQDEQLILESIREIVDDLADRQGALSSEPKADKNAAAESARSVRIPLLASPARDETDHLALDMLRRLLDPARWDVRVVGVETLAAELVELASDQKAPVVCIGSLPPGGLAHTRYLCKRLRAYLPHVKIIVGRWGCKAEIESIKTQLLEGGADDVTWTLSETRQRLNAWHSILVHESGAASEASGPVPSQAEG